MLMRIMSLEGGRVIKGDCHVLIALFRHCGGKFTVMTCVCGDPMDLAINMVIGSDDCFIKKKPPPVGIAGEPYFPPVISIVKSTRGARSFFTILVFF